MKRLNFQAAMVSALLVIGLAVAAGFAQTPARSYTFQQIGDGGGIHTVILLRNEGSDPVSAILKFRSPDGGPLPLPVNGREIAQLEVEVPAGATRRISTDGESTEATIGQADVTATGEIFAQAFFEIRGGQLAAQTAVESKGINRSPAPVRLAAKPTTGLAISNLDRFSPAIVKFVLRAEDGELKEEEEIEIPLFSQIARFVFEIFPELENPSGILTITASVPVNVVACSGEDPLPPCPRVR